jgi:cytochrome c553
MNCDDAFDALTDPRQADAAPLRQHLGVCPRCRALQEVLEPALSLLGEDSPRGSAPGVASPTESADPVSSDRSRTPFLSVEAVQLAETTAERLSSATGRECVKPTRRDASRGFWSPGPISVALRSAALILFGALAVYCVRPWDRTIERSSSPSLVPVHRSNACTRNDFPQTRRTTDDARSVVLTCVSCHMKEKKSPAPSMPASLRKQSRRETIRVAIVRTTRWPASQV